MITWIRPCKTPIELKDTPEMEKFATDKGWVKKPVKKAKTKKAD